MIPAEVRKLALNENDIAHDIVFYFGKDYHTTQESGRRRWLADQLNKHGVAFSGTSPKDLGGLIIFKTDVLKPALIGKEGEASPETLIFYDTVAGRSLAKACIIEYRRKFPEQLNSPVKLFKEELLFREE